MQSQRHERIAKRIPCTVNVGQRRYSGLVLNVSAGGLFIQTKADAQRGSAVGLELGVPGEDRRIPLSGTVAWRKSMPGQLRPLEGGGVGVRIDHADQRYYGALARWMRVEVGDTTDGSCATEEGAEAQPSWRVRVRASTSPRSRSLTVEAANACRR